MSQDTTLIIVAVIAALPGLVTAIGMLIGRRMIGEVQDAQKTLQSKTEEYHLLINSRLDLLLATVRQEAIAIGHAAGLREGRAEGREEGMALGGAQQAAMMAKNPAAPPGTTEERCASEDGRG